jgi:ketosteroid isomerase-like protein
MKRVVVFVLMLGLAVGLSAVQGEEKKAEDKAAADLKALDAKLTDAFKNGDGKLFDKYTADDYMLVGPLGHISDKKRVLERLEKAKMKIDDLKESDVRVRVLGDTGVVTGLLALKGKSGEKDISGEYRWTRVYSRKKGGDWLCILEQHTFVQEPAAPPKDKDKGKDK